MEYDDIVCTSCLNYKRCKEQERINGGSLRSCQRIICESFYTKISNMDVLEVGCGTKEKGGLIKEIVEGNHCKWVGIDIKKTDLATHVVCVTNMPFADKSFDWVIGSQTLEHWKRPKKALREINRVLKDNGTVSLTAPIHLHGTRNFVSGTLSNIEELFTSSGFNITKAQTWRKYHCDLQPCINDYTRKHLRIVGILNCENISSYIVHYVLKKGKRKSGFWKKFFRGF
jgi:ubiquinone/menaquinone biosynthesis C-methylase UbiE